MAAVTSRIAAAALAVGACVYGYAAHASHSHAESLCSCEESSQNHGHNFKSTRVPQEASNHVIPSRVGNYAPGFAPQFDGLNFFETFISPAQKY